MYKELDKFLNQLSSQMQLSGFEIKEDWVIDHICYRCETQKQYEFMFQKYSSSNELLIESNVGGRLIASFKLAQPLNIFGQTVSVLELPAPKNGKHTPEGFEHIEIVCSESFEQLVEMYSHLTLDKKGMTKLINPELEVEFDGCAIKFHHCTLESVIEYEKTLL